MKLFLKNSVVFIVIASFPILWIFLQADGHTDPFYLRFTSDRQSSLIIGNSKAAQGLQPKILNEVLNDTIYNYSFTISHSPYGPTYLNSIKKKLSKKVKNGIFIIEVDSWSISSWTKNPNDSLNFRERELFLGTIPVVSMNPNPFYFIVNKPPQYLDILTNKSELLHLHSDGWLEVNIEMDESKVNDRIKHKQKIYRNGYLSQARFSSLRLEYLIKTIKYLKKHGDVFLVRLPTHPEIFEIEKELILDFDETISNAIGFSSGYLDFTNDNDKYLYTDGNHLFKTSGSKVSRIIGEWISQKRINNFK